MRIKVLWIDDECNDRHKNAIIGSAEQDEIDFVGFESHEEGMLELEGNLSAYDAVVLDAKVKYEKGSEKLGLSGLTASRDRLIELNSKGIYLPYFIFTGQPGYMDNEMFAESYGEFYTKSVDEERLLTDIRNSIESKDDYVLQMIHPKVFACIMDYLGEEIRPKVLDLLKESESEKAGLYRADFNDIRKVVERIFSILHGENLIPSEIYNGHGSITGCSKFLSGNRDMDFIPNVEILPPTVSYLLMCLLTVTQDASHGDGNLRLGVDKYVKDNNSSYVYRTCIYQLLEFISWTKDYLDSDPKQDDWTDHRKSIETGSDPVEGTIVNPQPSGVAFFMPTGATSGILIPRNILSRLQYKEGEVIKASFEDYDYKNTGEIKQRVTSLSK